MFIWGGLESPLYKLLKYLIVDWVRHISADNAFYGLVEANWWSQEVGYIPDEPLGMHAY